MNRHEATRRVMTTLFNPGHNIQLNYVAPDGSRPVVVCTPGEHLSEVTERVEAVGGSANLILAEVNQFRIMIIETMQAADVSDVEGVNHDISMGMFWIRASRSRSRQSTFHIGGVSVAPQAESFSYA